MNPLIIKLSASFILSVVGILAYKFFSAKERRQNHSTIRTYVPFEHQNLDTCTICLNELKWCSDDRFTNSIVALPCMHKFHKKCIMNVFNYEVENHRLCPLCRRTVSEEFIRSSLK